jgi:hypothetical protein
MTKFKPFAAVALAATIIFSVSSANAQFFPRPIPMGPAPIFVPAGPVPLPMGTPVFMPAGPMPMPMPPVGPMPGYPQSFPSPGLGGLPGAGLLPQDGQIVAAIAQRCGGNPVCMGSAWGAVEVQRCRNGVGVPGGCFGPNGEIFRVLNNVLPENLQPSTIIHNATNDLTYGPGRNNDLVGCNGFVPRLFGSRC